MNPAGGGESHFDYFGRLTDIVLNRRLNPIDRRRVYAHELAHGIDEFVRQIPVEKFMQELRPLYNTLNNPRRTPDGLLAARGRMFTPEDRDPIYRDSNGLREYAAEAIRTYLTYPSYIKRVAPETATMIRKWVNEHPELSKIIQFNSLLAVPAAGLARRSERAENEF
jgi:hypothetical protein